MFSSRSALYNYNGNKNSKIIPFIVFRVILNATITLAMHKYHHFEMISLNNGSGNLNLNSDLENKKISKNRNSGHLSTRDWIINYLGNPV